MDGACIYCGRLCEEICPKNPAYWDGDADVKVPAGSEPEED